MKKIFCVLLTIAVALSLAVSVAAKEIYYGEEYVCVTDSYDFSYEANYDSEDEFIGFINFNDRYAEIELYGTRSSNAKAEYNMLKKGELARGGEEFSINGTPAVKTYDDEFVCAFVITYSENYIYHIDVESEDSMDCDYLLYMLSNDFYFKGGNTPPVPFGSTSSVGSASGSSSGTASGSSSNMTTTQKTSVNTTAKPITPVTQASVSTTVPNSFAPITTVATTTNTTMATTEYVTYAVTEPTSAVTTATTEEPTEKTNTLLKIGIVIFSIVAVAGLVIGIVEIVSSKKKKDS